MFFFPDAKQPEMSEWTFIDDLKQPQDWRFPQAGKRELPPVKLVVDFPDPAELLNSALDDFHSFCRSNGIAEGEGGSVIGISWQIDLEEEEFILETTGERTTLCCGSLEAVRRGIYQIIDLMSGVADSRLPEGRIQKKPWVKHRISRCFFTPIKRPPLNRDELLDDIDYYPDAYLSRLAREGINGLWLSISFRDLCVSRFFESDSAACARRMEKLGQVVARCLRYGIRIYLFGIEPRAWTLEEYQTLSQVGEINGAPVDGSSQWSVCPFAPLAEAYLDDCVRQIFTAIPTLGGMINISHGERATHCASNIPAEAALHSACPVCGKKENGEVIGKTLAIMEKAMHEVAPQAELIAWFYMPQQQPAAQWVFDIPRYLPKRVILLYNFESGAAKNQLGKIRTGGDYWLSVKEPADRFVQMADAVHDAQISLGAKLQVGCSHEVATIPFVPVPGLLFDKYRAMRELGVSTVMHCWFFGNYPGIMNHAAGRLAFEDFSAGRDAFLLNLAREDWGSHAATVVRAWNLFAEAYENYPVSNMFQYYGPMHDGPVWKLFLKKRNLRLAPTWKLEYGDSGDALGECMDNHAPEELVELTGRMSTLWDQGVEILSGLSGEFADRFDRKKDIMVAQALGIQFRSGWQILRFYQLREQFWACQDAPLRRRMLDAMAAIVQSEIKNSQALLELCLLDSSLGFHSEAEGYKYFPAKLKLRIKALEKLLAEEFPEVAAMEIGTEVEAIDYQAGITGKIQADGFDFEINCIDGELHFDFHCDGLMSGDGMVISVWPDLMTYPVTSLLLPNAMRYYGADFCKYQASSNTNSWHGHYSFPIPWKQSRLHFNIVRSYEQNNQSVIRSFAPQSEPLMYRLNFAQHDPAVFKVLGV